MTSTTKRSRREFGTVGICATVLVEDAQHTHKPLERVGPNA
ncbi:hypothetical protein [Roseovarius sp. Pro17]|nr:hypothetical protein [Roseovarius sp. Pro17]